MLNVKNNAESTLDGGINDSVVSLDVASGEGANFPGVPFRISIDDEILEVTAVSTDTFTVTREVEGTTKASHDSGATVELRITAGIIQEIHNYVDQDVTSGSSPTLDGANLTGIPDGALDESYLNATDFTQNSGVLVGTGAGTFAEETGATLRTSLGLTIGTDVLAEQTVGIANDNLVEIDDADAADNDYAKFTLNGLEGRSYSEVRSDLNVEDNADVTDTANVTSAGALMDTEVTNLAQVKAFDETDYATSAQGSTADSAVQPTGTPVDNDFAKFTNGDTVEGRSYSEVRTDLNIEDGSTADQSDAEIETAVNNQLTGTVVGTSDTQTLTNKTIDADNSTISNLAIGSEVTGASTDLTDTADLTYNADTNISGNSWVLDQDDMSDDDNTKVPTQQSVKAYVDNAGGVDTSGAPVDNDFAKFTDSDTVEGRSYSEVKQDLNLEIGTDILAEQTIGIANDNLVEMDDADAADNDYCKLTANGIEGRSYSEVKTDLSLDNVENTALSTLDAADLTGASGSADQVLTSDGTNASWEDAGGGGGVGGEYGINVETLSANKTLTAGTDEIYQWLDPDGSNRYVILDTGSASAGDRFIIKNNGASADNEYLYVRQSSPMHKIYAGAINEFIFNGTDWIYASTGGADAQATYEDNNLSIGQSAAGYDSGVSIGPSSAGFTDGVAVGRSAWGHRNGVAVGEGAKGNDEGTALGKKTNTNSKDDAVAIGRYSECERYAEIAHNIHGDDTDQENNITIGGWEGSTSNATPTEIFCGGTASQRFTIRASSILSFKLQVVARDNTAGEVAVYHFAGAIKRDGSNNTALVGDLVKDIIAEEDATWDVSVTADDSNEALKISVTGDGSNTVQWAARLDGVETSF